MRQRDRPIAVLAVLLLVVAGTGAVVALGSARGPAAPGPGASWHGGLPAGLVPPSAAAAPSAGSTPAAETAGAPAGGAAVAPPHTGPVAAAVPLPPSSGDLLIADRGNDRLLIVTPGGSIAWSMTIDPGGPLGGQSWGPDDAFFTPDGRHIVVNEENGQMIALVDIATRRIVWSYGHPGVAGSAPGYLNGPDDAYQLPDGTITVADIRNERILFIVPGSGVVGQYGLTASRVHDPPRTYAAPNGDVPLPDGGMLVTEIGGRWVDRLDASGHLVWSVHLADIAYPSDAQLLADGNVLVVDYSTPGRVEEVTPRGAVVWRYAIRSGAGMLSNPSLGVRLPNGNIAVTDDFRHRVVVIDPRSHRIVWQYGHTDVAGSSAGFLDNPDGLDPVPPATLALLATAPGP